MSPVGSNCHSALLSEELEAASFNWVHAHLLPPVLL